MTGSISNVSFYTRRGSDKMIARSKGGASKEKIKSAPEFEGFRLQQKEWKGCTGFALHAALQLRRTAQAGRL